MVPAENKFKRLSSVNHTTKTIHPYHHHLHHQDQSNSDFDFVLSASGHFVANYWCKSSTTFHYITEICFIVVFILYQVLQVTLWLQVGKVTLVASFW